MSYSQLREPASNDGAAFVSGPVVAKFCQMGIVTSKKWTPGWLTLIDGNLRMYVDKESSNSDQNAILHIHLTKEHQTSEIKTKDYSRDASALAEFFCFYVEFDNGVFSPTRHVKLGCHSRELAERISRAINLSTKGV